MVKIFIILLCSSLSMASDLASGKNQSTQYQYDDQGRPIPPAKEELNTLPENGGDLWNRLVFEDSPYLLQHAANPVDWYPWGKEAFQRAKELDKPVFLSIGYTTCHWCHVMEHESFQDKEVSKLMNETFNNIKVDREERPDIDNVYMEVTQNITEKIPNFRPNCTLTNRYFYFPPKARDINGVFCESVCL